MAAPIDSVRVRNLHVNTINLLSINELIVNSSIQTDTIQSSTMHATNSLTAGTITCTDLSAESIQSTGTVTCASLTSTNYFGLPEANIATKGIVRLDDTTTSISTTTAPTSRALTSLIQQVTSLAASTVRWAYSYGRLYYMGGPVGIGTRTPTSSLHVDGDVKIENGNLHVYGDVYLHGNIYQIP